MIVWLCCSVPWTFVFMWSIFAANYITCEHVSAAPLLWFHIELSGMLLSGLFEFSAGKPLFILCLLFLLLFKNICSYIVWGLSVTDRALCLPPNKILLLFFLLIFLLIKEVFIFHFKNKKLIVFLRFLWIRCWLGSRTSWTSPDSQEWHLV